MKLSRLHGAPCTAQPRCYPLAVKRFASCLTGLLLFAGCSTFQRDWNRLANAPAPSGIEGRWEGIWKSDVSRHTDRLRCIVSGSGEQTFLARFHARYGKIFSFGYTVPLTTEQQGNRYDFSGEANLGWYAGGRYTYRGSATTTNFLSTYRCKSDHGTFQMHRPSRRP